MLSFAVSAALFLTLPGIPEEGCSTCDGKGTLPCPEHREAELELERNVRFCSHVMGCRACGGALFVDCGKCAIGDGRSEERRGELVRWLSQKEEYFEKIGRRFPIGQSDHFVLFWGGGRIQSERGRLSDHGALHLYLERLETLFGDFCAATGATERDFRTTFVVMVWDREKHHRNAALHYFSQPEPNTGVKRMGAVGLYSVFLDPAEVDPDESHGADLYRNILHNVSHLLLANAWNGIWPSDMGGGWIDAGVAHYFEDRLDRRCTNFCYVEQDTHASFKGGWWRKPVKKLARSKNRSSFSDVLGKRTTQLTPEEHALCWSWCEFLISKDPVAFGRLCKGIKEGRETRDLLRREFGYTPFSFEDAWKEHVKTYSGK